jgi:hypothetical protein
MKAKKNVPFVSLLVVNYNGKDILKLCFPSLKKLNYPKNRYEIIVVDNGSTDGSIQFLKKEYPDVKIVQNKKNLGYVGINFGLKHCKGKYIYFLNNDLILQKDCLHYLVEEIQKDKNIGMAAHEGINYYNKKLVSGGTWASRIMYCGHHPMEDKKKVREIPYMGSGLIRKSVIDAYGYLFDEDYFIYAEDFDLGLRIRLLGMKTIQVKKARCYHFDSFTMKRVSSPSRNTFLLEKNLLTTFFKLFSLKTIILLFPLVLAARMLNIIKDITRLNFKNAIARARSILWVVFHFRGILIKRTDTQRLRKESDSYILRIFSEKYTLKKPYII